MPGFSHPMVLALSMLLAGSPVLAHGATGSEAMAGHVDPLNVAPILYVHDHHHLPRYPGGEPAADEGGESDAAGTQQGLHPRHVRYFERHSHARLQLGGPGLHLYQRD